MKKIIFILCYIVFNVSVVFAADIFDNCIHFQGKNGTDYCVGSSQNWYRCFSWCDAQGLKFASIANLCNVSSSDSTESNSKCSNLEGVTIPSGEKHTNSICQNSSISNGNYVIDQNFKVSCVRKTTTNPCICMYMP